MCNIYEKKNARIFAIQSLYCFDFNKKHFEQYANDIKSTIKEICNIEENNNSQNKDKTDYDFLLFLVENAIKEENEFLKIIKKHLKDTWSIERLNLITLCILKLAVAEFTFFNDTDKDVIINEYVGISKVFYLDDKNVNFINGILDKIGDSIKNSSVN
ncbi:transcription antitermination factor NusB [Anaplasmataceae bacterium AB001_6]|nr:transcription antitermination factor NusB [Anaplasmataceae bacterium AB001_6]